MKITYNVGKKTSLAEPSLKSNIVPDAKRNQSFTYLCWSPQSHSLWRNLPCPSILQKTETQMAFAEKGSFPSTAVGVGFIRPKLSGLDKLRYYTLFLLQ